MPLSTYRYFFGKMGPWWDALAIFFLTISAGLSVAAVWWLQYWPTDYSSRVCTADAREATFCAISLHFGRLNGI